MGTVTSNTGKQTPLPKLLTVRHLSGLTGMGNAVSAGNGGQVEPEHLDEANQLKEEYDQLREGKERLSITHLRKSLKRQPPTDMKTLSEEEEKLKQMFADKKDLTFQDFLKWKMQSNTNVTPVAEILQELFKDVDDGDGYLTPEELIRLEAKLNVTISQSEAEEIINRYDSNGDGRMDIDEFILYKQAKF